jgi:recombination protein RecA
MKIKKEKEETHEQTTVSDILKSLNKKYGDGFVTIPGTGPTNIGVDAIPSGSIKLDQALGCGGYPRGRITEVFGINSGGKTTLLLHAIASAQKMGLTTAFIDAEAALDFELAQSMGVDLSKLVLVQSGCAEELLQILCDLAETGQFGLIGLDSVAALVPKAELEGDMDQQHMGASARILGRALRKLVGVTAKTNTCIMFVNQLRANLSGFGSDTITPGGYALKFFSSVRLDVRNIGQLKRGEEVYGNTTKIKVVKNKLAPPLRTVEIELIFGKGFNFAGELLDIAVEAGIISKSGAWFSYGNTQIGQGKIQACEWLEQHSEVKEQVLNLGVVADAQKAD